MNNILNEEIIKFKEITKSSEIYAFSGCVEEKYPAIMDGLFTIGKTLNHKINKYKEQTCCTGPLTKMGLGNEETLTKFTEENLNLREKNEPIMLTSCNGCYSYMIKTELMHTDLTNFLKEFSTQGKNTHISGSISTNPKNKSNEQLVKPFLLHDIEYLALWSDELEPFIKYPLKNVKFVIQFGCHYLNQYSLSMENSFRNAYSKAKGNTGWNYNAIPTYYEDIFKKLGGKILPYGEYNLCCGGSTPQRQINLDTALEVSLKKFRSIHSANPDFILTNCPLCMYFMEESQFSEELSKHFELKVPILHVNELLGIMLGNVDLIKIVEESHKVPVGPILERFIEYEII